MNPSPSDPLHVAFLRAPYPLWVVEARTSRVLAANYAATDRFGHRERGGQDVVALAEILEPPPPLPWSADRAPTRLSMVTESGTAVPVLVSMAATAWEGEPALVVSALDFPTLMVPAGMPSSEEDLTRLELLQTLARDVGSAPAFDEAVRVALSRVCAVTGWTYGEAWVSDGTGYLRLLVATELDGDTPTAFREATRRLSPTPGTGLVGKCWSDRTVQKWRAEGGGVSLRRARAAAMTHFRSGIAVPALHGETPLAVLTFFTRGDPEDEDGFARLVLALASQLGSVLARKQAEDAYRELGTFLQELVAASPLALAAIDGHGRITEWNAAAERMFGWSRDRALGRHLLEDLQAAGRLGLSALGKALTGQRVEVRSQTVRRNDGTEIWADIAIAPLRNSDGAVDGAVLLATDVTDRHEVEVRVMEAQLHERRRLGEDLHDDLGQRLSGIAILAKAAESKVESEPSAALGMIAELRDIAGGAAGLARRLARGFYPFEVGDDSLEADLRALRQWAEKTVGVDCELRVAEGATLGRHGDSELFRIAQEAVSNAVQHGGAKRIRIRVTLHRESLALVVMDDGRGIADVDFGGQGLGLRNMRYRAERLGGILRVRRVASGGTAVACLVPRTRPRAGSESVP